MTDHFGHCLVCEQPSTRYGCSDCRNRAGQLLRELELYTTEFLPLMTQPARGQAGRMSPGYGSRSPARDDVLAALDPRSRPGDVDEDGEAVMRRPDDAGTWVRSIPSSVAGIAKSMAEERDELPPSTFGGSLDYIRNLLWWRAGRPDFDDFFDDLAELHRQARELAGDQPQQALGGCLNVTCDGRVRWGGPGRPAQCGECKRTYDGLDLVRLGVAEETAA
ncbi:hypothetical protein [Amycolatopsis lurida]|uniref:hypothetical protein n=1 Tax=Amycolatopsis lurida TaxID=31959 RepID=UPI00366A47B1